MNALQRQGRLGMVTILLLALLGTSPRCISAFLSVTPKTSPFLVPPSSCRNAPIPKSDIRHLVSSNGSRNGSPTALSMSALPMPNLSAIGKFYKTYPILAGFLTASTKASIADRLAQRRDVCNTKFDVKRNLSMVLYSGTILGISCEIMYNRLFPLIFGVAGPERDLVRTMKMVLFDGFINAPLLWLPPAYVAQALVYGTSKKLAIQKYITDVKENGLLKKYWSLWLPMSSINFLFVPAHFRILFVACVSFFWMIILSIVANNDQKVESCPLEPEPSMLNPRALD